MYFQDLVTSEFTEIVCQPSETPKVSVEILDSVTELCEKVKEVTLSPSAPLLEVAKEVHYPELPKQETSQKTQEAHYPALPKQETSQAIQEPLQPFTKEQLAQLYSNPELEASREFEICFVQSELRTAALNKHPLHELITAYAQARDKQRHNANELDRLRQELKGCEESAWILENSRVSGRSQCQDGISVSVSHRYQTCRLQRPVLERISQIQNQINRLANESHLLYSHDVASLRLKIEHYIRTAVHAALAEAEKRKTNTESVRYEPARAELRACLSVLFWWARGNTVPSVEARVWLGGAVAALLPTADWQDHAYVLCHVLRCPAGIASWAAAYVQAPLQNMALSKSEQAFCDSLVNHAVCVLAMLMRGNFIRNFIIN